MTMDLPPAADEENSTTQETREAPPAHLLTSIQSFSLLPKHGMQLISSMEFHSGGYKWVVHLNLDDDEHISANLYVVGRNSLRAGWEVNAIFNFFLYNHISDKYLCFRGKARRFHALKYETGYSKLITKNSLTEPSNGYLFNDTCVFGAEVFVINKKPLMHRMTVLDLSLPYKRAWRISKFSKLERIWKSEEFSAAGYTWNVTIFPNGCSKTLGRYVGVHLNCVDAKSFGDYKRLNVSFVFCFRNKFGDQRHHSMTATRRFTHSSPSWGFDDFIAIDDMRNSRKGFVVVDCCILDIQLSVLAVHDAT